MDERPEPEWVTASLDYLAMLEEPGRVGDAAKLIEVLERLLDIGAGIENFEPATDEGLGSHQTRYSYWYRRALIRFPDFDEATGRHENGWLQDDLADIATDLEDCLRLHATGNPDDALWEWRFSWMTHWGEHHARNLLRHLRRLSSDQPPPIRAPRASR